MTKRPPLSEDSFLKHLFSPKKNLLPTGIRRRPLAFAKGRTKARVASYNRMSATSQEVLRRSGMRDAYLKGEGTLSDAKRALRGKAVEKGFAKPLKPKLRLGAPYESALDNRVAAHVAKTLRTTGRNVNVHRLAVGVKHLPHDVKPEVEYWTVGQIRAYAGDSENLVIIPGYAHPINPLWYG